MTCSCLTNLISFYDSQDAHNTASNSCPDSFLSPALLSSLRYNVRQQLLLLSAVPGGDFVWPGCVGAAWRRRGDAALLLHEDYSSPSILLICTTLLLQSEASYTLGGCVQTDLRGVAEHVLLVHHAPQDVTIAPCQWVGHRRRSGSSSRTAFPLEAK